MSDQIMQAPYKTTKAQDKWLKNEKKRTGESIASIVRKLIQSKIDEAKK